MPAPVRLIPPLKMIEQLPSEMKTSGIPWLAHKISEYAPLLETSLWESSFLSPVMAFTSLEVDSLWGSCGAF